MSQEKQIQVSADPAIAALQNFWQKNGKWMLILIGIVVVGAIGWFAYNEYYQDPREDEARDAIFPAQKYYQMDSIQKALNGDGQHPGFIKVSSQYEGTKNGNLANLYAGSCYLKLENYEKAVKYLGDFSTSEKLTQALAYRWMGDAYADWGKLDQALEYYQKAGRHFKEDEINSSENLFLAAFLADRMMKNPKVAIELYQEIKDKYPRSQRAFDADNYLAQLGVYSDPN